MSVMFPIFIRKIFVYSTFDIINNDVFFEIKDPLEIGFVYRIKPAKDFGGTFNSNFKLRDVALVPIVPPDGKMMFIKNYYSLMNELILFQLVY